MKKPEGINVYKTGKAATCVECKEELEKSTFIFKDLHPTIVQTQFPRLLRPQIYHPRDLADFHLRQAQIVTRRKAQHAAGTAHSVALK